MLLTVANLTGGRAQSNCAVNLACEFAGIPYPCGDRWQGGYRVVLFDADPGGSIVAHYSSGENLPVSCEHRRLTDSNLEIWIQRLLSIAAKVDYLVVIDPPHSEPLTRALVDASDLIVTPCSASAEDLEAAAALMDLIRTTRRVRHDGGPKCLLVPVCTEARAAALGKFGEPVGPVVDVDNAVFENAYRERRWIGDFAWNSRGHKEIRALAASVNLLIGVQRA